LEVFSCSDIGEWIGNSKSYRIADYPKTFIFFTCLKESSMYKIERNFLHGVHGDNERPFRRTIKTGLTLEQAQAHCQNPETSSRTRPPAF